MRTPFLNDPPIYRLRYRYDPEPAEPDAIVGQRPRGSRRPHTDARVATVRRFVQETTLTYAEIAKRTGVAAASICRWTRDQGWKRPLFAPRATDTVPSYRASAKLKRRMLGGRITALAQRHIDELEAAPVVDPDKLAEALELYKLAKLAGMGRLRRRKGPGSDPMRHDAIRPIAELLLADIDFQRAPRDAIADFLQPRPAAGGGPAAPPQARGAAPQEQRVSSVDAGEGRELE